MTYEAIKRSYGHLTTRELQQELLDRNEHRYDTRMAGAADCMVDVNVLRACRELLQERGAAELRKVYVVWVDGEQEFSSDKWIEAHSRWLQLSRGYGSSRSKMTTEYI